MRQIILNIHRAWHPNLLRFGMQKETLDEWSRKIDEGKCTYVIFTSIMPFSFSFYLIYFFSNHIMLTFDYDCIGRLNLASDHQKLERRNSNSGLASGLHMDADVQLPISQLLPFPPLEAIKGPNLPNLMGLRKIQPP